MLHVVVATWYKTFRFIADLRVKTASCAFIAFGPRRFSGVSSARKHWRVDRGRTLIVDQSIWRLVYITFDPQDKRVAGNCNAPQGKPCSQPAAIIIATINSGSHARRLFYHLPLPKGVKLQQRPARPAHRGQRRCISKAVTVLKKMQQPAADQCCPTTRGSDGLPSQRPNSPAQTTSAPAFPCLGRLVLPDSKNKRRNWALISFFFFLHLCISPGWFFLYSSSYLASPPPPPPRPLPRPAASPSHLFPAPRPPVRSSHFPLPLGAFFRNPPRCAPRLL